MVSQTFDNQAYQAQLLDKTLNLKQLLQPFFDSETKPLDIFTSQTSHYRMRAEFRLWHTDDDMFYAMFAPGKKHEPIRIDSFPAASQLINALMQTLLTAIKTKPVLAKKLFQIDFLTSQKGEALISLLYHRQLDEQWQTEARQVANNLGISIIGRARKQKVIIGDDSIMETLHINMQSTGKAINQSAMQPFHYQQVENSFTQPNAGVNEKMIGWVVAQSQLTCVNKKQPEKHDLLELYCGNGNFTLPLAAGFNKVLATEIAKSSVLSAQYNATINGVDNVTIVRLSSEEITQALNGVRLFRRLQGIELNSYQFGCVFVDPPRAGLDADTLLLVQTFDRIIYMSCNPTTLVENLSNLQATHTVVAAALFDQFPYTHHIECGVVLQRKG